MVGFLFFFFLFVSSFLEFVARERELKLLELRREREDFLFFSNLSKKFSIYKNLKNNHFWKKKKERKYFLFFLESFEKILDL